uniref:Integrase n=1 Tax=Steinernema glaseri TaxID=37863 RepID=A0A1I7Y2F7_9BILA
MRHLRGTSTEKFASYLYEYQHAEANGKDRLLQRGRPSKEERQDKTTPDTQPSRLSYTLRTGYNVPQQHGRNDMC